MSKSQPDTHDDAAPLTPCPPWLLDAWQQLYDRQQASRLPHALLFTGISGIGKRLFAKFVAESLLCHASSRENGSCGHCESCRQLVARSHPDFRWLQTDGKSQTIRVDNMRDLVTWLQLSAPAGRHRIALIDQADLMNRNAANSLLKTLEEPGERAVLLLSADRPGSLPATVRSRCQSVTLKLGDMHAALRWLKDNGLADTDNGQLAAQLDGHVGPLTLLARNDPEWQQNEQALRTAWQDLLLMRASVGKAVDSVKDIPTSRSLEMFLRWSMLAQKRCQNIPFGADPATEELISAVHSQLDSVQWFTIHERLLRLYRSDSASFKSQTVLEGVFADIRLMTERLIQG